MPSFAAHPLRLVKFKIKQVKQKTETATEKQIEGRFFVAQFKRNQVMFRERTLGVSWKNAAQRAILCFPGKDTV